MDWLILALTLLAGCLMPVQPAVNAVVAQTVRSPYISAFFLLSRGDPGFVAARGLPAHALAAGQGAGRSALISLDGD